MLPPKIILLELRHRMGLLLSMQNLCVSNPCVNNVKCLMGFTNKKYLCVCKTGFTGENCENGKYNPNVLLTQFSLNCRHTTSLVLVNINKR